MAFTTRLFVAWPAMSPPIRKNVSWTEIGLPAWLAVEPAGGPGCCLGERLLPAIREAAREHSLHYPFGQTSIELGRLGPDAVALGAATLPVEALLSGTMFAAAKSDRPAS